MVVQLLVVQYWLDTLMTVLGGGGWGGDWYKGGGGAKRFFKRVPKRFFLRVLERILRVPKQLPDTLIQGAAHLNAKNVFFEDFTSRNVPKKHDEYSCNFACAHVIRAHVFNGGALAPGAVLTWHLNDFVGRGWVGWWLIQGWWWVGWWCQAIFEAMFFEGALSTYFGESLSHCPTLCFRFWRLYKKKCTKKKHEEYSWNFTCAHVIHARVFNVGAIASGAVLTWHLNEFVGRGWVEWWLIQGRWVGAATTDTRVVVGGLVVLSDFLRVPKRCFY